MDLFTFLVHISPYGIFFFLFFFPVYLFVKNPHKTILGRSLSINATIGGLYSLSLLLLIALSSPSGKLPSSVYLYIFRPILLSFVMPFLLHLVYLYQKNK